MSDPRTPPGFDEHTVDGRVEHSAQLPFRPPSGQMLAVGREVTLDVETHARIAAQLATAPDVALDELRARGLEAVAARARADAAVRALIDADAAAATRWTAAFEAELARHR